MFYTYVWLRENGTPYYVGKGKKDRAYRKGSPPREHIVLYPAQSEADAFETEVALIWYYGRKDLGTGCLRNFTNGGEGISGLVFSKESKKRMSISQKQRKDKARFGRVQSKSAREKIGEARKLMPKLEGCSSRLKNVYRTVFGRYRVVIKRNGKSKHFGTFSTEEEAGVVARGATCGR
jgi:hypothetical protein